MPLAEESKGYGFKGRTPAGRCIVEGRGNTGKLSLWVQDLKPQVKYEVFLIFTDNRRYVGLNAGLLDVDTKGKAEIRRDIVELHTLVLKEIVAVAVIAAGQSGVVSPLCGYRDEQVAWRHGFQVYKAGQSEEPVKQAEPEPPVIEPDPPVPEPEQIIQPEPVAPLPSPPRAILPTTTELPPPPTSQNTTMLIESIFNANTPFKPFTNHEDDIKWVKCSELNQMPLPSDLPHLMTEPFMQAAWADHEHFILGVSETGQYIIGMAGMYTQENRKQAKQLGFSQFRSAGDSGYWLMFVDF